ncbi:MAG: hypothetical protein FJ308_23195 [Planctomycetes bacterium]|nr:hypothetical protein [Planctomycetota bacterium]
MNLIEIMVEMQQRKTIRELRQLMQRLRDAVKEGEKHEGEPNENPGTPGKTESTDFHTTA